MAILTTGNSYSDGNQITSSNLNAVVNSATFDDPVDTSSGLNLTADSPPKIAINTSLSNKILTGGSLNNCPIGAVTASTGSFTTLSASGDISVDGSVKQSGNTGNLTLKGGDTDGANIELYGSNHATESIRNNAYYDAGVHVFRPVDGSSSSVVITSDGEVGIGPTSPSNTLHVENTTSSGAYINYDGQSNTEFGLRIESNAAGGDFESDFANGSTALLDLYANSATVSGGDLLVARTQSATPVLLVKGSGNVGIGTTAPMGVFHAHNGGTQPTAFSGLSGVFSKTTGGATQVSLYSTNTTVCDLLFSDPDDVDVGRIRYDHGSDSMSMVTNAATRMTIDSSGQVGIGTASPANSLHVVGDDQETSSINTALATSLEVSGNGTLSNSGGTILFSAASGLWKFAAIKSLVTSGSNNSVGHLAFCTRPDSTDSTLTEAMRINYDGKVGIGTTGPEAELHVQGSAGAGGEIYLTDGDDTGGSNSLLLQQSGGISYVRNRKSTGPLYLGAGDGNHLNILSGGNVGIGDTSPSYKLDVNGTGRFVGQLTLDDEVLHNISGTQTRLPGYYAGTYGVEIEQTAQGSTVHIGRSNGNCMNIGADAPASPTQLAVVYFRDTSTGIGSSPQASNPVGNISITDSTIHFNSTSDYRLKENEVDITDGIDRLKELKPYRFNFTRNPSKVVDGFFAHEVSPVVPESISGEKDQVDDEGNPVYQGIDQSKLVPLLTAALQEAVTKIEALEARVQTLEG